MLLFPLPPYNPGKRLETSLIVRISYPTTNEKQQESRCEPCKTKRQMLTNQPAQKKELSIWLCQAGKDKVIEEGSTTFCMTYSLIATL